MVVPSQSLFPSDNFEETAQLVYANSHYQIVSDNVMNVEVFFNSLNVQTITEQPVFETVHESDDPVRRYNDKHVCPFVFQWYSNEFISAAGGALSLWLGVSIGLLFEIIEFFIDLGINSVTYIISGDKTKIGIV